MCGIIAILNKKEKTDITHMLTAALSRLEYRGYDSSGISITTSNCENIIIKSVGRIDALKQKIQNSGIENLKAMVGIGHTRWATHGGVTECNAHPHKAGGVSIVHNGIIENYQELKKEIKTEFKSETDSEVIAQLINKFIDNGMNFEDSFHKTISMLKGTYAIVAMYAKEPNIMLGAKKGSPMAIGYNNNQIFIASDAIALSSLSKTIIYLEEGDFVICKNDQFKILDKDMNNVIRVEHKNSVSTMDVTKCGHEDYMLKEIFEEPQVLIETFNNFENPIDIKKYKSIYLIACGTSYYAGLLAKYWIEDFNNIQVNVEIASEFRYRNPVLNKNSLYIFISQSGETIDTLCAMRKVIEKEFDTLSIVNVANSSISRESKFNIQTSAGVEMGVASTKAFISQVLTLLLLSVDKKQIPVNDIAKSMQNIINRQQDFVNLAEKLKNSKGIIYMGRGTSYPISLEGSLKMKEITYISSEGCPAGEIKHGPIALIDENVYTVILAPEDRYYEKTLSNAQEIIARNGKVLIIGKGAIKGQENIEIDDHTTIGSPFVLATAVHLLAYYTAKAKNLDVDKPRNLAKSVTVE